MSEPTDVVERIVKRLRELSDPAGCTQEPVNGARVECRMFHSDRVNRWCRSCLERAAADTIATLQGQVADLTRERDEACEGESVRAQERDALRIALHNEQQARERERREMDRARIDAVARADGRAEAAEQRAAQAERALHNCRLMAGRQLSYVSRQTKENQDEAWREVLRFCRDAGVTGSVLRAALACEPAEQEGK